MGHQQRTLRAGIAGGISLLAIATANPAFAQASPASSGAQTSAAPDGTVQTQPTPPLPSGASPPSQSPASTFGGQSSLGEIVVTANKRAQSINEVPLTITAATGAALIERGVTSTADLAKIVPGLTAQPSPFNTPIYTLRGVGFYESTLSASPTVAVYTDEVPLPFSAMTKAAGLDLERVEVLKGPQGTLFGENTTGGAINFIAAKPTDHWTAGVDGSYGRFNDVDVQGFVSGPVTDTISTRISARVNRSDDWQYSITRNDGLGATRLYEGRILTDWRPSSRLKISINLNGWIDHSDSQAPQRIATFLSVPTNPQAPANAAYPYPPLTARAADWSTDIPPLRHHDYFVQGAIRGDYDLGGNVTLTSITAYERYKTNSYDDFDGTARNIADNQTIGHINTFSQELRVAGKSEHFNWVVGGNYERDKTLDYLYYYFGDSTTSQVGPAHMTYTDNFSRQNVRSFAAFGNAEYEVVPHLFLQGGVRYTDTHRNFAGCTKDIPGGGVAEAFDLIELGTRNPALPFIPIPEGTCATFDANVTPIITPLLQKLDENNVSWRAGINYKTPNRGLLYATISKGYKAGSFPTTSASSVAQYAPVKQESVLAYEVGFKQPLLDRKLEINGAAFYYDYKDKQLRGREDDPVFGPLDALVQIPKSRVWGLEGEINAQPFRGFTLDVAATFLNTKIQRFTGFNNAGQVQDFAGSRFPYAPKWQVIPDAEYDWRLNDRMGAFIGSDVTYNSATNASIGDITELRMKGYALLDLRAGIKGPDDRWRVQLFGRNVTNVYYWTNALQSEDVYVRYTGKPATYGVKVSFRFK